MADPVSWLMIEPGWSVEDANGKELGRVLEVTGDSGTDIFDGLAISSWMLGQPKYVPSEQVGTITDGSVEIRVALDTLADFDVPAATEAIEPEQGSRLERDVADAEPATRSRFTDSCSRLLEWFGLAGRR